MKTQVLALFALAVPTVSALGQSFPFNNLNAPVPDDDPSGLVSQGAVSGISQAVVNMQVSLTISGVGGAGFNGDLYATLSHNGTLAVLLNRPGKDTTLPLGYSDNGLSLTFDDSQAYGDAHTYRLTLAGPFPAASGVGGFVSSDGRLADPDSVQTSSPRFTSLLDFQGGDPNGTWTLFLADLSSGGVSQLRSWSLEFQVIPEPTAGRLLVIAGGAAVVASWRRRSRSSKS